VNIILFARDMEHRPVCSEVCSAILIETKDTVNTGTSSGEMTDTVHTLI